MLLILYYYQICSKTLFLSYPLCPELFIFNQQIMMRNSLKRDAVGLLFPSHNKYYVVDRFIEA